MRLTGQVRIGAAREAVLGFVLDPDAMASCVPGIRDVHQLDDDRFGGRIEVSVGPMHGDFAFTSEIRRTRLPDAFAVVIEGTDSVTRSRVDMTVDATLAPSEEGTTMDYALDVAVRGRLAIIGEMVLRAAAGAMVNHVAGCLRGRIEASAAADAPGGAR